MKILKLNGLPRCNRCLGTHPSPPPAPTRHTVGPTSDYHPTPQPAGHSARRPREPSGSATWAPRRDRGGQTPTRQLQRTTQLPFMNRASNDFPCTGLPGPPSLMFVLCLCLFVCLFVCLSVFLHVAVCTRDSLGHPPLNCFSATPGHRLLP